MRGAYKYPMLMTLSGESNLTAYNPSQSYYNQKFATMGGDWGFFNFLRPSQIKKSAAVIATGAASVATIVPITAPIAGVIAIGAGATAGVAAGIHSTYSNSPSTGTGYNPAGSQPESAPLVEKKSSITPIIVGAIGLIAAFKIAS